MIPRDYFLWAGRPNKSESHKTSKTYHGTYYYCCSRARTYSLPEKQGDGCEIAVEYTLLNFVHSQTYGHKADVPGFHPNYCGFNFQWTAARHPRRLVGFPKEVPSENHRTHWQGSIDSESRTRCQKQKVISPAARKSLRSYQNRHLQ